MMRTRKSSKSEIPDETSQNRCPLEVFLPYRCMIAATLRPGNSIHEGKAYENAPNCSFAICILGAGSSIAVRDGARARKYGKLSLIHI